MAITVKARARGLLRGTKELLGEKTLPKDVREALERLDGALKRTWADLESEAVDTAAADEAPNVETPVTEAAKPVKTEDGQEYPATDFAYVPDAEQPSTWKLRLTATPGGEPDPAIVGAAAAALGPGYRGNKVELPDDQVISVKAKVRTAWRKANPDKQDGEMPEGIREAAALREARNIGQWFEAEIHRNFTMLADNQFGEGLLTREERIALLNAIGEALDAFYRRLSQTTPDLYARDPYAAVTPPVLPPEAVLVGESGVGGDRLGEIVPLLERAVRPDGTIRIKIVDPGWGTSGYYPADVLKRDGPQVFPAGTHMFVDHPTATEEAERPERSLQDLGAVLVSGAQWQDDPSGGPGLYADAKVFSSFQPVLEELAPHIGVSINADGVVREGEAEGRRGRIVERLRTAQSVDFVTRAGRGGKVMALYEAARHGRGADGQISAPLPPIAQEQRRFGMDEKEIQALQEAKQAADAELARLREALLLREAQDVAAAELAKIEMPEPTRMRLAEALGRKPILVDGKLDREAFATQVRTAATAELTYLAEATGAGRITGMGAAVTNDRPDAEIEKRLTGAFLELGLSESLAQKAARGR